MPRERVQAWRDAYVPAWRSDDADAIAGLFSEALDHRSHPYDEPLRGRHAVVDDWLGDRDEPRSSEARYEPPAQRLRTPCS